MKNTKQVPVRILNTLTKKELDSIIEDKNTINLVWIKSSRQKVKAKIDRRLISSLTMFALTLGITIHSFANMSPEEQFISDFQQVLDQEVYTEEQVDQLVDKLQEIVDNEYVSETTENDTYKDDISTVDTSIFPQEWHEQINNEEENSVSPDEKVINEAIAFIKKFEWVRYEAYWDFKQYSICFGTTSFKWEKVSKEECDKRLRERVQSELLRINRLADNISWNKKVALISFFYNCWFQIDVLNYAARWDDKSVVFLVSQYNVAWDKYNRGLQKRRNAEINLYNWL